MRGPAAKFGAWLLLIASLTVVGIGIALRFGGIGTPDRDPVPMATAGPQDRHAAIFSRCSGAIRRNCVVDGDTFWFGGDKYRIADINTPEISTPQCDAELALGLDATRRLTELLNAGRFSFAPVDRDIDQYGRRLRRVMRGGQSLGDVLIAEGLAERWKGYRGDWC